MNRRSIKLLTAGLLAIMAGVSAAQHAAKPAPSLVPPPAAQTVETTADEIPQPPRGAHPLTRTDLDAWLDGYMPYALRTGDIAGAVVVVVKDGQILSQRGYGWSDVAKRKPVDPERTLFRPGSVAKLLTWTAVMQLVEQGKVGLDEDVNTHLDFKIPPFDGKPVTLRQAMTHTAGFEETGKNIIFYEPSRLMSLGDYLKAWIPKRIFAPGTTPAYSNYATALAGYIVERSRWAQDSMASRASGSRSPRSCGATPTAMSGSPPRWWTARSCASASMGSRPSWCSTACPLHTRRPG